VYRTFLALAGLLSTLPACGRPARAGDWPPNVVLVSFDTTRADRLSCYGYGRETTPNVDRLAKEGVLFAQCTSQSPKTAPSHMTVLTGLLPDAHGVRNLGPNDNIALSAAVPTLAEVLRANGYRTAAFTGGGHLCEELGFDRGFDEFHEVGRVRGVFERGMEAAEDYAGWPFFLFLHTYEVHDPYVPPAEHRHRWTDASYPGRIVSDKAELVDRAGGEWKDQHRVFWELVDPGSGADLRHLSDLYDASLRFADEQLGRLLERLDELGELDRTVVVFLSDHGEELGERGEFLHDSVRETVLRVPLLVRPPAGAPRELVERVAESPARLLDVLPTVLRLVGAEPPPHLQGRDLLADLRLPLTAGNEVNAPDAPSHWPRARRYALRRGDWKLEARASATDVLTPLALFDLATDPLEENDVSAENDVLVEALLGELERTRAASRALLERLERGDAVELRADRAAELEALGYVQGDDD
jgi:arylsulfatase A-like enzyme